MNKKELPRFVVYRPDEKEYHICLEVNRKYLRWCSYYPPTPDIRFARSITRIADIPVKAMPKKKIFDEGTYATTRTDNRQVTEKKIAEGLKGNSIAFILNGKRLKGRFAIKHLPNGWFIRKFKDKYAAEEDVLSEDLSRTIYTMLPDYDEKTVKLTYSRKPKKARELQAEEEPPEEVTADITIGNTDYHFAFYTSDNEPGICLITNTRGEAIVLKQERNDWVALAPAPKTVLRNKAAFAAHASALYALLNE